MKSVAVLVAVLSLTAFSCVRQDSPVVPEEKIEPGIEIPLTEIEYPAKTQFINVKAEGEWTIEIDFGDGVSPWVTLDQTKGSGSVSGIVMKCSANAGQVNRSCTLALITSSAKVDAVFTQKSRNQAVTDMNPDTPGKWMELPAMNATDPQYFFTHDMTLNGRQVRNYSFYYDADALLSVWVAYPLNKSLIGSGSRTNAWSFDPKVPSSRQPSINGAYKGGYDRGHQLPSADRLISGANQQTFYFTNMTPQRGNLNQQAWAKLEAWVRNKALALDTLYVVTGADIKGATEYATDNVGAKCLVPVGYFKALLGYKPGTVGNTTGGYVGIAFYYEHRAYSTDILTQSMTIDALENKLGYDFFVNLPEKIGADAAAKVESTIDNWWK